MTSTNPLYDVTNPLYDITNPLYDITNPLYDITNPLYDITNPLYDITNLIALYALQRQRLEAELQIHITSRETWFHLGRYYCTRYISAVFYFFYFFV